MKKICMMIAVILSVLDTPRISYGMASEQFGPSSAQRYPTSNQTSWPANFIELVQHESRVYSRRVNGSETLYFKPFGYRAGGVLRSSSQCC
jgi:hypothetical protein